MTVVRLRHLAEINPPSPAFERLSSDAEVTFLPMEAVWPDSRLDISRRRRKADIATGYTRFQDGDVLLPKITPTFEADRAVLIRGLHNGVGAGTTELHVLRAGPRIDRRFLLYLVKTHSFLRLGEAEMIGVAGQKRVPEAFLQDLPVSLPSLDQQRRIADFLDAETARIDRMVRLQEILRRRLDERERSFLDLAIENLASRFGVAPLRRFILGVEQGTSPQCDAVPAKEDEWGVLKVSCLRPLVFLEGENKRLPVGMRPNLRHEVREGDLLIARANTPELVGSTAVVPGVRKKLLLSDKIFRIRTVAGIDPRYVAIVASGSRVRALCAASSNGASQSMANIRFEEVKAWPIPPATPTYQAELVSRVESSQRLLNELRAKIDSQIRLLAERRQALITAAVNGEFDVSTASGKGVAE